MKYSSYSKDRKRLPSPKPLTRSKLQSMLRFVKKDSKALCDFILSLQERTNPNTALHPYWKLFTELVRNSPVCGTFQYLGNEEVIDSLRKIADGQFKSSLTPPFTTSLIFFSVPLLISFLQSFPKDVGNTISPIVRAVITEITECMAKPYSVPPPPASHYLPVQENFLSFFPSLPVQTGSANYAADKLLSNCEPDKCRKYAGCHPVLIPRAIHCLLPTWHML